MAKRKKRTVFVRRKIIFLSLVMSMSLIGVGYASWDDVTTINLSMKTGFVKQSFETGNILSFENGDIFLRVSDDENTLNIKGDVYPNFNENLTINVVDKGTVPSFIADIYGENNNISDLKGSFSNEKTTNSYNFNKKMDSFKIHINPNNKKNNHKELKQLNATNSNCGDGGSLENEIEFLKEKIMSYDNIENYKFSYTISYELESWKKNLYIDGDINVIPDPEVLENMNKQLEKLQTQLCEQKEYEKQQQILAEQQMICLEQQKLQESQKSLELENDSLEQKMEFISLEKNEDNIEKPIDEPLKLNNETDKPNNEIKEQSIEQKVLDKEKEEPCSEEEPIKQSEKTSMDMNEHSEVTLEISN